MTFTARTETYVNVSSLTTPFNITVTKPSGTVDGDILFCWIGWYAATTIDSVPANWNLLGQYVANTDRYALYYKIASDEPANWVWSFAATAKVRAVCSCYTSGDFNGSNPIDVVSNTAYRTSDANCIAASMSVAATSSPLVFWGGVYSTSSKTFTKPSVPTTDWVENDDAGSTTPDFWTEVCSMIWAGSGATGVMSATISAALATKHAFAVALKPPTVTAKAFADSGGGLEGFANPFRALGFGETGHGTEGYNNPFRGMGFADTSSSVDAFYNPYRTLTFADAATGNDAFGQQLVGGVIGKGFNDVGFGSEAFTLWKEKTFSDTCTGVDSFATESGEKNVQDVGDGIDVFTKQDLSGPPPYGTIRLEVEGIGFVRET